MNKILAVIFITFKEGLRQRILYGVVIFALLLMFFAVLVSGWFMRDISKIIVDFCLSAVSIGGLLIPFFLAVNLLSKDIERKTIFAILAKPISRTQYILGKFGGLIFLAGVVMAILAASSLLSVWIGMLLYGASFFSDFSLPAFLQAVMMSWLGVVVLIALVMVWCSVTTSAFLATLLTLFTYIIGQTIDDVVRFLVVDIPGVEISKTVQHTVQVVKFIFPNLSVFDLKLQAAHNMIMPFNELATIILYGMSYSIVALSVAIFIFRRRDIA